MKIDSVELAERIKRDIDWWKEKMHKMDTENEFTLSLISHNIVWAFQKVINYIQEMKDEKSD